MKPMMSWLMPLKCDPTPSRRCHGGGGVGERCRDGVMMGDVAAGGGWRGKE